MQLKALARATTANNADACEFCPHEPHRALLVCANYQLDESAAPGGSDGGEGSSKQPQSRIGRCYLYEVRGGGGGSFGLETREEREVPSGIFDLKWCPVLDDGRALLALACADGSVYLDELAEAGGGPSLRRLSSLPVAEEGSMCLSLCWEPRGMSAVVSHSDGSVSVLERGGAQLRKTRNWVAHGFEAWIAAWDSWASHSVYSGGDDALFRGWDLRTDCSTPTFTSREHGAGVCSIASSPHREHILASGSYDESLRVWDTRAMRRPLCTAALGGGVWRIRWHPSPRRPETLAAACMHYGCHVLRFDEGGPSVESVGEHREHGPNQLAYGLDWSWAGAGAAATGELEGAAGEVPSLLASCSFYDRSLHLWAEPVPP
eukprot:tig00000204_g17771.t1